MNGRRIPELWVEQAALDELAPARRASLDPDRLADGLEAVAESDRELLERHPPAATAAGIRARLRARGRGPGREGRAGGRWLALAAAPALAGLVFLLLPLGEVEPGPGAGPEAAAGGAEEVTRIKGDPALLVYRKGPRGPELLRDGTEARQGDVLQLGYRAAGAHHGVLLSIDGRGAVTLHFPATPDASTGLGTEGPVLLPWAYALDDAPGFERFLFVYGDEPIDVASVLQAVGRDSGGADDSVSLGPGLESRSLLLTKSK